MTRTRIGLAGYGFGGRVFHAPLIASAAGCELAGVVTRSPHRRAQLEQDHPGTPVYESIADLAAEGTDAIAISTPAQTHVPIVLEAISLGLAVVSDKPFAMNAEQARQAVSAAESAGVVLSVYQNRRWDSDLLTLRRLLAAGTLGEVTLFESSFERFKPDDGPSASGGGILLDFGSHLVDQALLLFGPVDSAYGEMHAAGDLDERFFALLHHRNGMSSHVSGDQRQGAPAPRFRVRGTQGTYVAFGMDGQESALIAGRTPAGEGNAWGTEPKKRWGRIQRGDVFEVVPSERGRWDTFYPAFGAAVRGEGPVPVDPHDAVASLTVLDAIRRSASEGRSVAVSETPDLVPNLVPESGDRTCTSRTSSTHPPPT